MGFCCLIKGNKTTRVWGELLGEEFYFTFLFIQMDSNMETKTRAHQAHSAFLKLKLLLTNPHLSLTIREIFARCLGRCSYVIIVISLFMNYRFSQITSYPIWILYFISDKLWWFQLRITFSLRLFSLDFKSWYDAKMKYWK